MRSQSGILVIDDSCDSQDDVPHALGRCESDSHSVDELLADVLGADNHTAVKTNRLNDRIGSTVPSKAVCRRLRGSYATFIDSRMPPGIDGIETIQHNWSENPVLQCVFNTAHTDSTWEQSGDDFGSTPALRNPTPLSVAVEVSDPALELAKQVALDFSKEVKPAEGFVELLREELDAMQSAFAAGDFAELARLGHWLKGAGGVAGFDCLTGPADRLERLAQAEELYSIYPILEELVDLSDGLTIPVTESVACRG